MPKTIIYTRADIAKAAGLAQSAVKYHRLTGNLVPDIFSPSGGEFYSEAVAKAWVEKRNSKAREYSEKILNNKPSA